MRIATLIISLIMSLAVLVQSCAAAIGGSLGTEFAETAKEKAAGEDLSGGAAFGFLAAVLWIVGAGLVLAKPKASMWIYGVAALCLLIAGTTGYSDGYIWAVVSLVFSLMSWRGVKEKANKDERERARYQADLAAAATAMQHQQQGSPPGQ